MKRFFMLLAMVTLFDGCENTDNSTDNQEKPTILSMSPSQVYRGQTGDGRITGTNFSGVLAVNLGSQIDVREISGVTPTELAVRFYVHPDAQSGSRTITVSTGKGTTTSSSALSVGTNRLPIANFTVDPLSGVASTVFHFNGTASKDQDGVITRFQWDFGDGTFAEGATATHRFSNPGNFKVRLSVTDNDQSTGISDRQLQVKNGALPIARFSYTPSGGDLNTLFRFDASASDDPDGRIVDYVWTMGDGSRKSGKVIEHKLDRKSVV